MENSMVYIKLNLGMFHCLLQKLENKSQFYGNYFQIYFSYFCFKNLRTKTTVLVLYLSQIKKKDPLSTIQRKQNEKNGKAKKKKKKEITKSTCQSNMKK